MTQQQDKLNRGEVIASLLATLPRLDSESLTIELAALSSALAALPQNGHAWTYTIRGLDGAPYITRTLLPRIAGHRLILHRIHREDRDRHVHNHPWATARFLILTGGYVEQRFGGGERTLAPGDVNLIDASTLHRVSYVEPNTWTLGVVGERVQDWGFLVDGLIVPHEEYFARNNHASAAGAGRS